MQTHIEVDLHQRFCYVTAVDASGKRLKQSQVVNEGAALRAWLRQLPAPCQVVVEASGDPGQLAHPLSHEGILRWSRRGEVRIPLVCPRARIDDCTQSIRKYLWTAASLFIER